MKIEDEEDLLYGESGNALKLNSVSFFYQICIYMLCLTSWEPDIQGKGSGMDGWLRDR